MRPFRRKASTAGNRPPRTPFWLRRPVVLDRVAQTLVWLITVIGLIVPAFEDTVSVGTLGSVALAGAGFAVSYRWPRWGAIVLGAAPVIAGVFGVDPVYTWNIAVFAAFRLALHALPGLSTGLVLGLACLAGGMLYAGEILDASTALAPVLCLTAGAAGGALRAQSQYWRSLEERARDAEASRDGEIRRRLAEERVRIARDLHDVVGHEIAVVNMQLGAAEVHLDRDPDRSRAAIEAAREGVRNVLGEMQSLLHVLRRGEDEGDPVVLPRLDGIADLVAAFAARGMTVGASFSVDGTLPDPDPGVGAAAYRLVQEALTNAQRYGDGTVSVSVVRQDAATVRITVTNPVVDARRTSHHSGGLGLVGMRERVESVGGTLDVRETDGIFRVSATMDGRGTGNP